MSEYDDMPPLEDMDNLVDRIKEMQVKKEKSCPSPDKPQQVQEPKPKVETKSTKPGGDSFGGMKKGFLFGGKPSSKPKKKVSPSTVDYVVKPSTSKNDLVFDDVQHAMKETQNSFAANKDAWLTDDLLKKLDGNQKLMKQMADPKFSTAIQWMQKDPKKAMEMYKDDADVQEFFAEFCKLLGMHFNELGKNQPPSSTQTDPFHISPAKESKPPSEDEEKMNKILANPEIREILMKPDIQNLFTMLRSKPEKAQTLLNTCDARMRADIKILVSAGLLGMEAR